MASHLVFRITPCFPTGCSLKPPLQGSQCQVPQNRVWGTKEPKPCSSLFSPSSSFPSCWLLPCLFPLDVQKTRKYPAVLETPSLGAESFKWHEHVSEGYHIAGCPCPSASAKHTHKQIHHPANSPGQGRAGQGEADFPGTPPVMVLSTCPWRHVPFKVW